MNPPENMDQGWIIAGNTAARYDAHVTIIVKLTDGTNIAALSPHEVGARILDTVGLTRAERSDTYLKVRTIQNLIAIDTYRPSAEKKILQLTQVNIAGTTRPARAYLATSQANTKGVVHGIPASVPEEEFQRELEVQGANILQVRRIGTSNSLLITVEGSTLPRYALYSRLVIRMHPYRPRSLLCVHCYTIGHRADVCPNKISFVTCPTCSTNLPLETGLDTPHQCEPHCRNCQGEHPPGTPSCPARAQADHQTKEGNDYRRHKFLARHKPRKETMPQKMVHWPDVPTSNRFTNLNSPSRSRSRSPGRHRVPATTPVLKQAASSTAPKARKDTDHIQQRRRTSSADAARTTMTPRDSPLQTQAQRPAPCIISPMQSHTANPHSTYRQALMGARATPTAANVIKAMKAGLQTGVPTPTSPTLATPLPSLPSPSPALTLSPPMTEACNDDFLQHSMFKQLHANILHTNECLRQMRDSMEQRDVFFEQLQESLRQRDVSFQQLATQVEQLTERLIQSEKIHTQTQATLTRIEATLRKRPHSPVAEEKAERPHKVATPDAEIASFPNDGQAASV